MGGGNHLQGLPAPKQAARVQPPLEEDQGEDAVDGDAGSANPIEKAARQLSKIVAHLSKEKKLKADKSLEALDRAESGGDGLPRRRIRLGGSVAASRLHFVRCGGCCRSAPS